MLLDWAVKIGRKKEHSHFFFSKKPCARQERRLRGY